MNILTMIDEHLVCNELTGRTLLNIFVFDEIRIINIIKNDEEFAFMNTH